ncbi:MAG TPA: hypothetical protein VNO52_15030 [Methylomirabilota bacterium]|nr:hypothetical protein [Methylomirabilota bacterium]
MLVRDPHLICALFSLPAGVVADMEEVIPISAPEGGRTEATVTVSQTVARAYVTGAADSTEAIGHVTACLRASGIEPRLVLDLNAPPTAINPVCLPDHVPAGPGGWVCEMAELFVLRHENAAALTQILSVCREIYTQEWFWD